MAVNKVALNGEIKLDLTADTVTPQTLLKGKTAHNAAGELITGVYEPMNIKQYTGHAACLRLGCGFARLPGADDHDHGAESVLRRRSAVGRSSLGHGPGRGCGAFGGLRTHPQL